MKLRLEGQDLVGEIRNTPLQQVLEELAAWSGIVFEIESQENPPISINFYRTSLQEAVERLTGNTNSIIYFERDETGQNRVRFVRVLSRNPRPSPPVLHYIGTGAITKRGDEIVDSPEQAVVVLAGSTNLVARQKAIEVLVTSKGAPAIQALKMALADPAVEVRVAAIDGLVTLGAREALPQILPALKDSHPGVRQSAVMAVGHLGDAGNVKDLKPLLRDPDSSVAASAEMAIQKLSGRRP
ncbi:MAG: HEAT repeat domain-containing protein [Acidobacteriia bacterium]|nr:HEAT repeat domain-containing protein [Terriglobia bacterium]